MVDHPYCIIATLESIQKGYKLRGVGSFSEGQRFSFFFLHDLCISQIPYGKKKVFDFKYIIILGIYLLSYAKLNSKYDIRYF
jgi:hypothetical protein